MDTPQQKSLHPEFQVQFMEGPPDQGHLLRIQTFYQAPEGHEAYLRDMAGDLLRIHAPKIAEAHRDHLASLPKGVKVRVIRSCTLDKGGGRAAKARHDSVMSVQDVLQTLALGVADARDRPKPPRVEDVGALTPTFLRLLFRHFDIVEGRDYTSLEIKSPALALMRYTDTQGDAIDRVWRALRMGGLLWCENAAWFKNNDNIIHISTPTTYEH